MATSNVMGSAAQTRRDLPQSPLPQRRLLVRASRALVLLARAKSINTPQRSGPSFSVSRPDPLHYSNDGMCAAEVKFGPPRSGARLVSVVMPALNAASTVEVQLDALARQAYGGDWELVVADNGSSDATRAITAGLGFKFPTSHVGRLRPQGRQRGAQRGRCCSTRRSPRLLRC